LLKVNIVV